MSMIGIITLMGLVTKNGILFIDFVNNGREAGAERTKAILTSTRVRLRPIIMTTFAMIFGMLPLGCSAIVRRRTVGWSALRPVAIPSGGLGLMSQACGATARV